MIVRELYAIVYSCLNGTGFTDELESYYTKTKDLEPSLESVTGFRLAIIVPCEKEPRVTVTWTTGDPTPKVTVEGAALDCTESRLRFADALQAATRLCRRVEKLEEQ